MATVRRWTGHEARALRVALRLSVRGFAEHLGVAVRTISKWEAGGTARAPRPDTQAILDTALSRAGQSAQERFALLCESTDDRQDSPQHHLLADLPEDTLGDHIPALILHLRELWHVLVRTDNLLGPRFALAGVLDQIAIIEDLLPLASGNHRTELVMLAATYAESAAWLYEDAAEVTASGRWVARAIEWAHEADDHQLLAWALFRRSQHATAARDSEGTLSLTRAARRDADRLPPPMRAAIAQQEADGYALRGDEVPAHHALDLALRWAVSDDSGDARQGHGSFCTSTYLELQRASCWIALGRPERAVQLFEAVLPAMPTVYRRDRGTATSQLAQAYLANGRPEAAAVAGQEALGIARTSGSVRTERAVAQLARRLSAQHRIEPVRALLDDLGATR